MAQMVLINEVADDRGIDRRDLIFHVFDLHGVETNQIDFSDAVWTAATCAKADCMAALDQERAARPAVQSFPVTDGPLAVVAAVEAPELAAGHGPR